MQIDSVSFLLADGISLVQSSPKPTRRTPLGAVACLLFLSWHRVRTSTVSGPSARVRGVTTADARSSRGVTGCARSEHALGETASALRRVCQRGHTDLHGCILPELFAVCGRAAGSAANGVLILSGPLSTPCHEETPPRR